MHKIRLLPLALALTGCIAGAEEQSATQFERPSPERIREDLERTSPHHAHPRVLANAADFARVQGLLANDATLKRWYKAIEDRASAIRSAPPVTYSTTSFSGVLSQARTVVEYAQVLGFMYRMTGDRSYADRLWLEIGTVCDRSKFKDWGTSHYGDAVEMSTGLGIAYDWLYDVWTPEQKRTMREHMVDELFKFTLPKMKRDDALAAAGGGRKMTNMRLVFTGGNVTAALAIADEPETGDLATEVISAALVHAEPGMALFAPEGAWYEGVTYWSYAMIYHTYLLASLRSALGTTYGLEAAPGFSHTADFPVYLQGPCDTFNIGDTQLGFVLPSTLSWFGATFNPDYGRLRAAEIRRGQEIDAGTYVDPRYRHVEPKKGDDSFAPKVMDLLFYRPEFATGEVALVKDRYFRETEVAVFRSGWDEQALYTGIKFGANAVITHCHLDLGSFMLDAQGVRWAEEYGQGSYDWKGYLNADIAKGRPYRFDFYSARAEGHNTLVINPDPQHVDQNLTAQTAITRFVSNADGGYAVGDLTPAYQDSAVHAERGLMLTNRRSMVVVQDEVDTKTPSDIWWGMHTRASISIAADKRSAILSLDGKRLWAGILSPGEAEFGIVHPPTEPEPQRPRVHYAGVTKLSIHVPAVQSLHLTVGFSPLADGESQPTQTPAIRPLAAWAME